MFLYETKSHSHLQESKQYLLDDLVVSNENEFTESQIN